MTDPIGVLRTPPAGVAALTGERSTPVVEQKEVRLPSAPQRLLTAPRIAGLLTAGSAPEADSKPVAAPVVSTPVPKTMLAVEEPLTGVGEAVSLPGATSASIPWIPHVQPTECQQYKSDEISLGQLVPELLKNGTPTYFTNIPGMGWGVTKSADALFGNPHAEVFNSEIDDHLPQVPGGTDRVVPTTKLIWLDQAAAAHFKDGTDAAPARAGLYSFQQRIPDVVEYVHQQLADGEKPHPDYIRMHYLDSLTYNLDRSLGNWLVDKLGKPYAIDNGGSCGTLKLDSDYGWLPETLDVIKPDYKAEYLQQSLDYAKAAKTSLTDDVLEAMIARARQVPEFNQTKDLPDFGNGKEDRQKTIKLNFDLMLRQLKYNRDNMPEIIQAKLDGREPNLPPLE